MRKIITLISFLFFALSIGAQHETVFDMDVADDFPWDNHQVQWHDDWAGIGNNGGFQKDADNDFYVFPWRGGAENVNPLENLGVGDTAVLTVRFWLKNMIQQSLNTKVVYFGLSQDEMFKSKAGTGSNGSYGGMDQTKVAGFYLTQNMWTDNITNLDGTIQISPNMGSTYSASDAQLWGLANMNTAVENTDAGSGNEVYVDGDSMKCEYMLIKTDEVNTFKVSAVVTNTETDTEVLNIAETNWVNADVYGADSLFFTSQAKDWTDLARLVLLGIKLEKYPAPTMPSVVITSPVNFDTYTRGDSVTVTATATSNATSMSPIASVILTDGVNTYPMSNSGGDNYTCKMGAILGSHTLTVTATDDAGKITSVSDVTISMLEPSYTGGSGTLSDPYIISTASDLLDLAGYSGHWSDTVKITKDIDMNSKVFTPIGTTGMAFTGMIDGGGYIISNLVILDMNASGANGIGLVGTASGATIKNLGIDDVSTNYPDDERVAPFIGYGEGGVVITNCFADNVNMIGSYRVGGIAGWIKEGSTISDCWANGSIISGTGWKYGGGVVGIVEDEASSVTNCAFYGSLSGGDNMGGIVGSLGNSVNDVSNIISNCYFINTAGDTRAYAGTSSKLDAELQDKNTYIGFDFSTVWSMDTYAKLKVFEDHVTIARDMEFSTLSIFPNPVQEQLTLSQEVTSLVIYNLNGQLVKSATNTSRIDVSNLKAGLYLLKADQDFIKFVKE